MFEGNGKGFKEWSQGGRIDTERDLSYDRDEEISMKRYNNIVEKRKNRNTNKKLYMEFVVAERKNRCLY